MKLWAIAAAGVVVVGILAVIGGERATFVAGWVMVGILWLLFMWLIATVFRSRAKRNGGP